MLFWRALRVRTQSLWLRIVGPRQDFAQLLHKAINQDCVSLRARTLEHVLAGKEPVERGSQWKAEFQ